MDPKIIKHIEEKLVEYAGPMGKYVLKKELSDMGFSPNDELDITMMRKVIDDVVKKAIYNQDKRHACKRELLKIISHGT